MQQVRLGQSGLRCSRLAYGGWRLAGAWERSGVTAETRRRGREALLAAYEAGYTLFDLADIYCEGICEEITGSVLREIPEMRARVLIASKCGIRKAGDPAGSCYRYDFSRDYIIRSCEQSLKRLHIDTLDLYQLHRPDLLGDPEEVAAAFMELRRAGKVREFGVSNFTPSQVETLQRFCPVPLVVNQVEISLAQTAPFFDGTLEHCLRQRITPLAWSPLARGRLGTLSQTDAEHHPLPVPEPLLAMLDRVGAEHGTDRSGAALAWLRKHPAGILPIVGSTDPDRIRAAARSESVSLSREEWYLLMEAAVGKRLP